MKIKKKFYLYKLSKLSDYDRKNGVWNIVDALHVNPVNFFVEDADVFLDWLEQPDEDDI